MSRRSLALAIVAIVLLLTSDDRQVGRIADGRQMTFTAVAMTESGTIGQAPGRDLAIARSSGDSVSRFGMGMSLAQVPAAALAPVVERRWGGGVSQPLFLVAPLACVLGAALLSATSARLLGGLSAAESSAILLSTLASPFASYAAMDQSEALQGLAIAAAFAFALRGTPGFAALAGMSVGVAVLTKSSLLLVAPFALLPLARAPREGGRLLLFAAAGALPLLALWAYFEVARFGHLFGGYDGEGFTHPLFDGLWRLTVGPNKGLVLYFPAVIASSVAAVRAARGGRLAPIVPLLVLIALLALAAPWWAWDGVGGWGPRLLVPAIPLLAATAAVELQRWRRAARVSLVALSVVVNLPPLLQHPTPVVQYIWTSAWPIVDGQTAARVPAFARRHGPAGQTAVPPETVLATDASASPFVLLPWFFDVSRDEPSRAAARLNAPPWSASRPDLRPSPPIGADEAQMVAPPPRVNYWGRGFIETSRSPGVIDVYDAALENQVLRAQRVHDTVLALSLALKLESLAPGGLSDALLLESYRLAMHKDEAIAFLQSLSMERRAHPAINVVLALWDRDEGNDERARVLLQTSAASYPDAPVQRALMAPLSAWPADFARMTEDPTLEIRR